MTKDVDYYMGLPWEIEMNMSQNKTDSTPWLLTIPALGSFSCFAVGKDRADAMAELEDTMRYLFGKYMKNGVKIPEPEDGK